MKAQEIEKAEKLAAAINNFRACYKDCVLHASDYDGQVRMENMIEWLIENPHMAQIAEDIARLSV